LEILKEKSSLVRLGRRWGNYVQIMLMKHGIKEVSVDLSDSG